LTAGTTSYLLPNFTETSTESMITFIVPTTGTIKYLFLNCGTAPGVAQSVIITVRINGIDSVITATVSGTNTSAMDFINSTGVVGGELITIKSVVSAGSVCRDLFVSLRYQA
jgi:hypothetical protein